MKNLYKVIVVVIILSTIVNSKTFGVIPYLSVSDRVNLENVASNAFSKLDFEKDGSYSYRRNNAPDVFSFVMTSSKDSVKVGEEFELTVRVDWINYGYGNAVHFLPEWYKYKLKVIIPSGFIQTGGDYFDYCTKDVNEYNNTVEFKIRGKYLFKTEQNFILLRGFDSFDDKAFIYKAELFVKNVEDTSMIASNMNRVFRASKLVADGCTGYTVNDFSMYINKELIPLNEIPTFYQNGAPTKINFEFKNPLKDKNNNTRDLKLLYSSDVGEKTEVILKERFNNSQSVVSEIVEYDLKQQNKNYLTVYIYMFDNNTSCKVNDKPITIPINAQCYTGWLTTFNTSVNSPSVGGTAIFSYNYGRIPGVDTTQIKISLIGPSGDILNTTSGLSGTFNIANVDKSKEGEYTYSISINGYKGCSLERKLSLNISETCNAPKLSISPTNPVITSLDGSVVLTASDCKDGQYKWNTVDGKVFSTSTNQKTIEVGIGNYSVDCIISCGGNVASTSKSDLVTVSMKEICSTSGFSPQIENKSGTTTFCNQGNISLKVTGCYNPQKSRWYNTNGSFVGEGETYTTTISSNQTFSVDCENNCYPPERLGKSSINFIVTPYDQCIDLDPQIVNQTPGGLTEFCGVGQFSVMATGCPDTKKVRWWFGEGEITAENTFTATIFSNASILFQCISPVTGNLIGPQRSMSFVVKTYTECNYTASIVNNTPGKKTIFCTTGWIDLAVSGCPNNDYVKWYTDNLDELKEGVGPAIRGVITRTTRVGVNCINPNNNAQFGWNEITFVVNNSGCDNSVPTLLNKTTHQFNYFCQKGWVNLEVSGCPNNNKAKWYKNNIFIAEGSEFNEIITSTTKYKVTCENPVNTEAYSEMTFHVNPDNNCYTPSLVNLNPNGQTSFCGNGSLKLIMTGCGSYAGAIYEEHSEDGGFQYLFANSDWEWVENRYYKSLNHTPTKSGYIKAFCVDESGNINYGTEQRVSYKINPIPVVKAVSVPACIGNKFLLSAEVSNTSTNTGNINFEWKNQSGSVVMSGQNAYLEAKSITPEIFTVKFTNNKGCSSTASTTVTNLSNPTVSVPSSEINVCEGQTVQLIANATTGGGKSKVSIALQPNTTSADRSVTIALSGTALPNPTSYTIKQKGRSSATCVQCQNITLSEGMILGYRSEDPNQRAIVRVINGCAKAWWFDLNGPVHGDWISLLRNKTVSEDVLRNCVTFENIDNCSKGVGCEQGTIDDLASFTSKGGIAIFEVNVQNVSGDLGVNKPSGVTWATPQGTAVNGSNGNAVSISGKLIYNWEKDGITFKSNIQNPQITNVQSSDQGKYVVKVIDTRNCMGTASVQLNPIPSLFITSELSKTICSGSSVSYAPTASIAGASFSWTRESVVGISPSTVGNGNSSINEVLTNTTSEPILVRYLITPTNSSCPGISAYLDVTVLPSEKAPTLKILKNNATTINAYPSEVLSLQSTSCNDCSVEWYKKSLPNGTFIKLPDFSTSSIEVIETNTGSYQYQVKQIGGCGNNQVSNLVTTTVSDCSPLVISQSSPIYVCKEGITSLTISSTQKGDGTNYRWFEQLVQSDGKTIEVPLDNTTTSIQVGYGRYLVKSCPVQGKFYGVSLPVEVKQLDVIPDIKTVTTVVPSGGTLSLTGADISKKFNNQSLGFNWTAQTAAARVASATKVYQSDSTYKVTDFQSSKAGSYTLSVQKTVGSTQCFSDTTITIYNNPSGCTMDFDGEPSVLCQNEKGVVSINIKGKKTNGQLSYRLNEGDWQISNVFTDLKDGRYVIEVKEVTTGSDQGGTTCRAISGLKTFVVKCDPKSNNAVQPGKREYQDCIKFYVDASQNTLFSENLEPVTLTAHNCEGQVRWRMNGYGPSNRQYYKDANEYLRTIVVTPTSATAFVAECHTSGTTLEPCVESVYIEVNQELCRGFSIINDLYIDPSPEDHTHSKKKVTLTSTGCTNGRVDWYDVSSQSAVNPVDLVPERTKTYIAICRDKDGIGNYSDSYKYSNCTKRVTVYIETSPCASEMPRSHWTKYPFSPGSRIPNESVYNQRGTFEKNVSVKLMEGDNFAIVEKVRLLKYTTDRFGNVYHMNYQHLLDNGYRLFSDYHKPNPATWGSQGYAFYFSKSPKTSWTDYSILKNDTKFVLQNLHHQDSDDKPTVDCEKNYDVKIIKKTQSSHCDKLQVLASTYTTTIGQPVTLSAVGAYDVTWRVDGDVIGSGNSVTFNPYNTINNIEVSGIVIKDENAEIACQKSVSIEVLQIEAIQCEDFKMTASNQVIGSPSEGYNPSSIINIKGCDNGAVLKLTGGFGSTTTLTKTITVIPTATTTYEAKCYLGNGKVLTESITIEVAKSFEITASTEVVGVGIATQSVLSVTGCASSGAVFEWTAGVESIYKKNRTVTVRPSKTTTYEGRCTVNNRVVYKSIIVKFKESFDCLKLNDFEIIRRYTGSNTWEIATKGCEYTDENGTQYGYVILTPEPGSDATKYKGISYWANIYSYVTIPKDQAISYTATCYFGTCAKRIVQTYTPTPSDSYTSPKTPVPSVGDPTPVADCVNTFSKQKVFNVQLGGGSALGGANSSNPNINAHYSYSSTGNVDGLLLIDEGCSINGGTLLWWNDSQRSGNNIGTKFANSESITLVPLPTKLGTNYYYGTCYTRQDQKLYKCDVQLIINIPKLPNTQDIPKSESLNANDWAPTSSLFLVNATTEGCKSVDLKEKLAETLEAILKALIKKIDCNKLTKDIAKDILYKCILQFESNSSLSQYKLADASTDIDEAAILLVANCGSSDLRGVANKLVKNISGTTNAIDFQNILKEIPNTLSSISERTISKQPQEEKVSECPAITDWSTKLFISPDGRPVQLPVGAIPTTFKYKEKGLLEPPKGTLQGFKAKNGDYYYASISSVSNIPFQGYKKLNMDVYIKDNDPIFKTFDRNKTVKAILVIPTSTSSTQCGYDYIESDYIFNPKYPLGNFIDPPVASTGSTNICRSTVPCQESDTPDAYAVKLMKALSKYGNLDDVKIKYKKPNKTYEITTSGINDNTPKGTVITLIEDTDGKIRLDKQETAFKGIQGCNTCASTALTTLEASLNIVSKNQSLSNGKITPNASAIDFQNLKNGISYQNMTFPEMLAAFAKGYNSFVENASVPEYVWKPENEVEASDKGFPVKDSWGVVSGGINGSVMELTDQAQFLGLILTVISNPIETANQLGTFVQSAVTDWEKTKATIKGFGGGFVGYDPQYFEPDKNGVYAGYGTGLIAGTLSTQAFTGGIAIVNIVKNAPAAIKKRLDNIANSLTRVKAALKKGFPSWTDADIDRIDDAISLNSDADDVVGGCNIECAAGKYGCFTADTDIKGEHSFVKANKVVEGMYVQSYNHQTHREEPKLVNSVKKHLVSGLLLLTLSSGEIIETTPNHPFYVHNTYADAETLVIGDTLFTADNKIVIVNNKVSKDTVVEVYNFTIAENNNYFVGKTGILVHNTNCLFDKIKNNFPSLHNKFSSLSDGLKAKFLKDFPDDDAILGVLNQGKAFEAWKKLSEITGATKAWISKSKAILERVNTKNLSDVDIEKLKNYYSSHQMPTACATRPRCTFQGDGFTVNFDDYGHPRFESFVPEMKGVGKIRYKPSDINNSNYPELLGKQNSAQDLRKANDWANATYNIPGQPKRFLDLQGGNCKIIDNDGNEILCTWHHHEDGRTMIPVPTAIHDRTVGGAGHTGGASVIYPNQIQDFFPAHTW